LSWGYGPPAAARSAHKQHLPKPRRPQGRGFGIAIAAQALRMRPVWQRASQSNRLRLRQSDEGLFSNGQTITIEIPGFDRHDEALRRACWRTRTTVLPRLKFPHSVPIADLSLRRSYIHGRATI